MAIGVLRVELILHSPIYPADGWGEAKVLGEKDGEAAAGGNGECVIGHFVALKVAGLEGIDGRDHAQVGLQDRGPFKVAQAKRLWGSDRSSPSYFGDAQIRKAPASKSVDAARRGIIASQDSDGLD